MRGTHLLGQSHHSFPTWAIIIQVTQVQNATKSGEAAVSTEGAEQRRLRVRCQFIHPSAPTLVQGHGQEWHLRHDIWNKPRNSSCHHHKNEARTQTCSDRGNSVRFVNAKTLHMIIAKGVENTQKEYKEENVYNAYICFWRVIYMYIYTHTHFNGVFCRLQNSFYKALVL